MTAADAGVEGSRPQRSELSVPASAERFFAKAAAGAADAVVLDLEDGVAEDRKDAARLAAIGALGGIDWGGKIMSVRVNGIGTPWCHRDIVEVAAACPRLDRIVLPKSAEPFDIRFVAALLDGIEAARGPGRRIGIAALVETPKGVGQVEAIATAHPRLESVIFGLGDYMAEMRTPDSTVGAAEPRLRHAGRARAAPQRPMALRAGPHRQCLPRRRACGRSTRSMPTTATRLGCGLPPGGRGRWATRGNGRSTRTRWRRSTRSSGRIRRGWTGRGACSRCSKGPPARWGGGKDGGCGACAHGARDPEPGGGAGMSPAPGRSPWRA